MTKILVTYEFESEDDVRAHFAGETRGAPVPNETPAVEQVADASPTAQPGADVDSDGMPWDEKIHASTKTTNADGTWKARQGAAAEAKAARAAFKAAGGNVSAPAAETTSASPGLPGSAPAASTTGLPGAAALPESAPEPISYAKMVDKITGMLTRGTIQESQLPALYEKHGGAAALETEESARAGVYADLCTAEPDLIGS